jgi:N-acetylmuramoyl-L-alanine amidase
MDIRGLNDKLNNVRGTLDFQNLTSKIDKVSNQIKALNETKLALNKVGNSINGIKSLTESLPVAKESIANLVAVAPIATLTNEMPGLEDKMNKALTTAEEEIVQQMSARPWTNPDTGEVFTPKTAVATLRSGIKKANKLVGTPQSIQSAINKVTGELPDFNKIMKGIVPAELSDFAKDGLAKVAALESAANALETNLTGALNNITALPNQLKKLTNGLGGLQNALNVDLDISIKGVDNILDTVTNVDAEINNALGLIQNAKLAADDHLTRGIKDLAGAVLDVDQTIQAVKNLKNEKFTSVINDINSAAILQSAKLGKIVPYLDPDTGKITTFGAEIVPYLDPDTGKITIPGIPAGQARAIIENQIGKLTTDIEKKVNSLTTDLSTNIVPDDADSPALASERIEIGQAASNWSGAQTVISESKRKVKNPGEYAFTRVNSPEELVAEFNSVKREVTELVLHWSEHFLDQSHAGAEEVHERAITLNQDGIGYHYVVKKNGQIERGRPVYIEGRHTDNHDKYSIGVVFIGGLNSYSTEKKEYWKYGKESLTTAQMKTLDIIVKSYYAIWPGCSVFGHNDIEHWAQDPGFDVGGYLKNRFKTTNQTDPELENVDQDALVAEQVMLSDAITENNAPFVTPAPAPAIIPPVPDKEQVKTAAPLPGAIPILAHGYDEIVQLLNNDMLKEGDIIKPKELITDEVVNVVLDREKQAEFIAEGKSIIEATRGALGIKNMLGIPINSLKSYKESVGKK